jgi:hypothetical protein
MNALFCGKKCFGAVNVNFRLIFLLKHGSTISLNRERKVFILSEKPLNPINGGI